MYKIDISLIPPLSLLQDIYLQVAESRVIQSHFYHIDQQALPEVKNLTAIILLLFFVVIDVIVEYTLFLLLKLLILL